MAAGKTTGEQVLEKVEKLILLVEELMETIGTDEQPMAGRVRRMETKLTTVSNWVEQQQDGQKDDFR